MCMVCVEYRKGKMTSKEALNNIGEMIQSAGSEEEVMHLWSIANDIVDKELPFENWEDSDKFGNLSDLDIGFQESDD